MCVSRSGFHQILSVKIDIKFNSSICAVYDVNRAVNCFESALVSSSIFYSESRDLRTCVCGNVLSLRFKCEIRQREMENFFMM